jgi:hypothetical protein
MKEFIKKNFTVIVSVIALLSFFKSCGDARTLANINKKMETLVYIRSKIFNILSWTTLI